MTPPPKYTASENQGQQNAFNVSIMKILRTQDNFRNRNSHQIHVQNSEAQDSVSQNLFNLKSKFCVFLKHTLTALPPTPISGC